MMTCQAGVFRQASTGEGSLQPATERQTSRIDLTWARPETVRPSAVVVAVFKACS